uniref:Hydantoinase/oxoprolinase n=1 Tax=Candidatus Kentrum sp. LPFa TaxID=2126335 RepID=A0A450X5K5_9GAMM|nr:MAG: Hydantoinase/oxoprolinase [Candidatus Kentron sp. LPFa]VFK36110.1 MAG: Hydantoinase/oxoprolinase [Candidatus Kentron sp. LPFa]
MPGHGHTHYNIKWAGDEKTRIVLWKDFFTTYLLFLSAHLFMGRQFPQNRCTTLDINATMPMRFRQSGELRPAKNVSFEDLGEVFEKVIQAAAREVQGYTGLGLNYGATFYEAIASTQSLANRLTEEEVFVVVDVGGGTTDVAVLKGHRCLSSSSFAFAGNNPFGAAFNEKYLHVQLNIGKADDPMGGKSHLLSAFIRTLANYTALLVGAAIKQTGLDRTKGDKLKLSVCLFGQAWHLAKFYPQFQGSKTNRQGYRTAIVMKEILDAFNNRVRPKLLGKDFQKLGENNILIGNDAPSSKKSCCMGAINTASVDNVPKASEVTFLGISYRSADKEKIPWHELDNSVRIGSYDDIEADPLCPGLMIPTETLDNRLINNDRWTVLSNPGGPIKNRYIQRNYIERPLRERIPISREI